MRRGTAYRRRPSAPLTAVTGSSYSRGEYPTPSATPYGSSQNEGKVRHVRPTRGTPSLDAWARRRSRSWATPQAHDSKGGRSRASAAKAGSRSLALEAKRWGGVRQRPLVAWVASWPTPTAGDAKSSGSRVGNPDSRAHPGVSLTDAACRSGRLAPTTTKDGPECPPRLNPRFVEWLMGFDDQWTAPAGSD